MHGHRSSHKRSRLANLQEHFHAVRDMNGEAMVYNLLLDDEGQARLMDQQATQDMPTPTLHSPGITTVQFTSAAPDSSLSTSITLSTVMISTASNAAISPTASTTASPSATSSFTPILSSSAQSHTPPFYAAIALACIVICACMAAFVAWYIRLRLHRRKHDVLPPWANKMYSLATNRRDSNVSEDEKKNPLSSLTMLIDEEIAVWEPRGDRDVGEPKRAEDQTPAILTPAVLRDGPRSEVMQPHAFIHTSCHLEDGSTYPLPPPSAYQPFQTPSSHNGTLTEDKLPVANSFGPLQITNYTTRDGRSLCTSSASSSALHTTASAPVGLGFNNVGVNLAGIGTLGGAANKVGLGPDLTDGTFGTPRECSGFTKPRYLALQQARVDGGGTKPLLSNGSSDCQMSRLPTPTHQLPERPSTRPTGTASWIRDVLSPILGFTAQNIEQRLTPTPKRHAPPPKVAPFSANKVEECIEYVGGDLVGFSLANEPKRQRTRSMRKTDRRPQVKEFEVGKMKRPMLESRTSSIYSTASASTSYSAHGSSSGLKSCSGTVYSYYGYGRTKHNRTHSSSTSTTISSNIPSKKSCPVERMPTSSTVSSKWSSDSAMTSGSCIPIRVRPKKVKPHGRSDSFKKPGIPIRSKKRRITSSMQPLGAIDEHTSKRP